MRNCEINAKRKYCRLSVIIPGYNNSIYNWRRCIFSVLSSINDNDEIICINDGSEELLTEELLGVQNESRVIILNLKDNKGQAAARNHGLEIAKGQYVTFVDSDDEVIPGCYDDCFTAISKYNSDIVVYGLRTIWINDGLYREYSLPESNWKVPIAENIKELKENFLFDYPVNKIYKHSFLRNCNIKFESGICPGEDVAFNLLCLIANAEVSIIPTIGYVYYRVDGTTLSRAFPNIRKTLQYRHQLWSLYQTRLPKLRDLHIGESFTEEDLLKAEWKNMWKKGAKEDLLSKVKFAKLNRQIFKRPVFVEIIRVFVYSFLRKYFYIKPIRRWHLKHLYPDVLDMK